VQKGDFCRVNKASFEGSVEVRPRGSTLSNRMYLARPVEHADASQRRSEKAIMLRDTPHRRTCCMLIVRTYTWVQALASHTNGVYTGLGYIFEDRGEILEVKGELVSSDRLPVDPTQACEASSLTVGGISRACRRVLQRHVCTGGVGRHLHRPRVAADDHVGEGGQAGVPAALSSPCGA
jgi:hypothetical protein